MVMMARTRGYTLVELMIAIGIMMMVLGGFATANWMEVKAIRGNYYRAVAMEIVDGEMEALAAGEWRNYAAGEHVITPSADARKNLPEGQFVLTVQRDRVRFEWRPADPATGGTIVREAAIDTTAPPPEGQGAP